MYSIELMTVGLIILGILLVGLILFYMALLIARWGMKRPIHLSIIFRGFGQKMWMTTGLGMVFFSVYLAIAMMASHFQDTQMRLDLFLLAYEHPIVLLYLGLLAFACISTSIYLVRLLIKYFYNSRRY